MRLYHGTRNRNATAIREEGLKAQLGERTQRWLRSKWCNHPDLGPVVWLTDEIGAAQFYAHESAVGREGGTIFEFDSEDLPEPMLCQYGGDFVDDNGDYHPHNEYAFRCDIAAELILDEFGA